MSKHDVIAAVEAMKKSQFGATAIKVELEAQLDRRNNCNYCEGEGRTDCDECDGDYEGSRCEQCDGAGRVECGRCDGYGHIELASGRRSTLNCRDCLGEGEIDCGDCDGGRYENCEYCDEGRVDCDCDGGDGAFSSELFCHEYLMEKLSTLGLAEKRDENICLSHDSYCETNWYPVAPLKYAEFYNDGSVDSEFTFTLSLEKPETVLLLPKVIEVFNEFAAEAGDMDTRGAGMHMALLNNEECVYPAGTRDGDTARLVNFERSMRLLMPALYFLGSSDERSRGLEYRRPAVGRDTHRTAIDFRNGALEFRVFNTCYDKPEAILDNVVVMSNCLKYWTNHYKPSGLSKITPMGCLFGLDGSDTLDRFYVTSEHIDLLNAGLERLKPKYYTIRELKQQRKFGTTKAHTKNREKRIRVEAEIEYKEYEDRWGWSLDIRRNSLRADLMDRYLRATAPEARMMGDRRAIMATIEQQVEALLTESSDKQSLGEYVERKLRDLATKGVGQYTLSAEG